MGIGLFSTLLLIVIAAWLAAVFTSGNSHPWTRRAAWVVMALLGLWVFAL